MGLTTRQKTAWDEALADWSPAEIEDLMEELRLNGRFTRDYLETLTTERALELYQAMKKCGWLEGGSIH